MTSTIKKLLRAVLAGLIMLGLSSALITNVSAKHVNNNYRHHRRAHFHKLHHKFGTYKKRLIHGKAHYYWYRFKNGHHRKERLVKYHKRHRIRKRIHRRRRHSKALREVNLGSKITDKGKDIDAMDNIKQMEYQTIKKINVDRAAHNLDPLEDTQSLRNLARYRANQLVKLGHLTHKNSQGDNYYEVDAKQMRLRLGDYSGENIASAGLGPILMDDNPHVYNNDNGKDMANMDEDEMVYHDGSSNWGHRYNTLNSHYKYMGIGAARETGTNNYYLAENFSS